jgi:hypothetical protein
VSLPSGLLYLWLIFQRPVQQTDNPSSSPALAETQNVAADDYVYDVFYFQKGPQTDGIDPTLGNVGHMSVRFPPFDRTCPRPHKHPYSYVDPHADPDIELLLLSDFDPSDWAEEGEDPDSNGDPLLSMSSTLFD